jgi:acyl-CoA thioesterase I
MFRILFIAGLILSAGSLQAATFLVLGDSISAGYGLPDVREGWVSLLGDSLDPHLHQIINVGISGETTAGGLDRLPRLLAKYGPNYVIIELGGNDGLRGISLAEMERNLRAMIQLVRNASSTPVLLGMQLPPNYGKPFANAFEAVYPRIAKELHVVLVNGFMQGIGDVPDLMQADQIHPNAKAQPLLKDKVLKSLLPLIHSTPLKK